MYGLTTKLALTLCVTALLALGVSACSQQKSAAPAPQASVATTATTTPEAVKPPVECSAAANAANCADILHHLGKDAAAAFGTPGHEPSYTDPDTAKLPPCKNGTPACEVWERMWPQ